MKTDNIRQEAEAQSVEIIALRRELHKNPETAKNEYKTAALIEREFDKLGIPHVRVGDTGVLGTVTGKLNGDKVILLRADIDAMPVQDAKSVSYRSQTDGAAHVCGHDAHTAALIGAARLISERRDSFGGEVRLMFQQAEEIGYGARIFIDNGVMDKVSRVIGWHTAPNLPAGTIGIKPGANNASVDYFKITVNGHGAHISTPQLGVDALYIASVIVTSAQGLVTKLSAPTDPVLVGIGKMTAGTAYNVVAEKAIIEGTVRAFSPETRAGIKAALTSLCENIAVSFKGSASVEWQDFTSPLVNDKEVCDEVAKAARGLFGDDCVTDKRELSLGGDDFAELLLLSKGAYLYFGTANANSPDTCVPNHNGHFDIDESVLTSAPALMAEYALRYLKNEL